MGERKSKNFKGKSEEGNKVEQRFFFKFLSFTFKKYNLFRNLKNVIALFDYLEAIIYVYFTDAFGQYLVFFREDDIYSALLCLHNKTDNIMKDILLFTVVYPHTVLSSLLLNFKFN